MINTLKYQTHTKCIRIPKVSVPIPNGFVAQIECARGDGAFEYGTHVPYTIVCFVGWSGLVSYVYE